MYRSASPSLSLSRSLIRCSSLRVQTAQNRRSFSVHHSGYYYHPDSAFFPKKTLQSTLKKVKLPPGKLLERRVFFLSHNFSSITEAREHAESGESGHPLLESCEKFLASSGPSREFGMSHGMLLLLTVGVTLCIGAFPLRSRFVRSGKCSLRCTDSITFHACCISSQASLSSLLRRSPPLQKSL